MYSKPRPIIKKIHSFIGHKDCLYTLELTEDANVFYTAGGDGLIVKWNLQEPELGKAIAQVQNSIYSILYIEARKWMIVGHNFDGIHIIDLQKQKETRSLKITDSYIFDIQIWGNFIYVACGDGELCVVDLDKFIKTTSTRYSDKSARCIAIHPKINEIAVGFSDFNVRILDKNDLSIKQTIKAHSNSVFTVCYSPDYNYLLTGGRDAKINVWNCWNNYEQINSIAAHLYAVNHLQYATDGNHFASASMDKSIKLWDANTFQLLKVIDKSRHAGHGTSVNKLKWIDNNKLLSVSDDRTATLWEVSYPLEDA
ncbi:MAG: WD40 repeat domain-containing protein [Bacteroidota bacterium]|nr:WD40 repeat domain-containing protein [Bacteroidota bacterium]